MKNLLDSITAVWDFLKIRKKYWLGPFIMTILVIILIAIFSKGTALAPFVYSNN